MRISSLLLLCVLIGCTPADRPVEVEYLVSPENEGSEVFWSEAVRVGHMLYLSGTIGVVPGDGRLIEGGIEAEARQTLDNIRATLERHGSGMDEVVKCTVFLVDEGERPAFNAIYQTYFPTDPPARSGVSVRGLALDSRVEVECFAAMR